MTAMELQVRGILAEVAGVAQDADAASHLYADLGIESVDAMRILVAIEERLGVNVPDEEWLDATSIRDISTLVSRLACRGPAAP
jgi:acyl carrier protein